VAFWIVSPWRPGGRFAADVAREDLRFGLPVVGAAVLAYACFSLDRFALGRFAGPETLGFYAFALSLAMLPSNVGSSVVNTVLLPSYRHIAGDRSALRNLHLHAVALSAGLNLLFAAVALVLAQPFLRSIYGTKWDAAADPLRILAFAGLLRALASLCGEFLVGVGRPSAYRAMNFTHLVVAAAAIAFGLGRGGAIGVAWAMTAGVAASVLHGWLEARAPLGTSFAGIAATLGGPMAAFAASAIAGFGLLAAAPGAAGMVWVLAVALVQAAVFLGVWFRLDARLRRTLRPVAVAR
jgi:PST family polysaccharide transporter